MRGMGGMGGMGGLMAQAQKMQQKLAKVQEELNEFLQAKGEEKVMEGGDLLHAVISLLRYDKVDAETALIQSTNKFV